MYTGAVKKAARKQDAPSQTKPLPREAQEQMDALVSRMNELMIELKGISARTGSGAGGCGKEGCCQQVVQNS